MSVIKDLELFSWKTTCLKDHLEVCLLLSGVYGIWSSIKITLGGNEAHFVVEPTHPSVVWGQPSHLFPKSHFHVWFKPTPFQYLPGGGLLFFWGLLVGLELQNINQEFWRYMEGKNFGIYIFLKIFWQFIACLKTRWTLKWNVFRCRS